MYFNYLINIYISHLAQPKLDLFLLEKFLIFPLFATPFIQFFVFVFPLSHFIFVFVYETSSSSD